LFFQAFGKNLFTRPKNGDITSVKVPDCYDCVFYFKSEYYETLSNDLKSAQELGKFKESNANEMWVKLLKEYLTAEPVDSIVEDNYTDYVAEVGTFWN
jgi:Zn-finger protein